MKGARKFGGRLYLLSGRGTKAGCLLDAEAWRERGYLARVTPWNPFDPKGLRVALDDYAVFTFPKEVSS